MSIGFEKIVNEIKNMPLEAKKEIKTLVEKYIIEERREEIFANYKKSKGEGLKGKLIFSKKVDELKELI